MNEKQHNLDRQNSRQYLDVVKGFAIFLMLWGHSIQYCTNGEFDFFENNAFKFIYSFHMPLFKQHYIYTTGIFNSDYDFVTLIGINIFRWAIGLIGCVFVLVLVQWFIYLALKFRIPCMLLKATAALGKESLQVYCLSVSLLSYFLPKVYAHFCARIGLNIFAQNMIIYNIVFTPIVAIGYAVGLYYLVKLLDRVKIGKVIFGR